MSRAPQWEPTGPQSRAVYPHTEGHVSQGGIDVFYEVYGEGDRSVVLVPPWSIVHSRTYKAQIGYLSRHFRVIAYDPRGNGRSGRPADIDACSEHEFAKDLAAVLDATGTERAHVVCYSRGAQRALLFNASAPERVESMTFICPGTMVDERRHASHLGSIGLMQATDLPEDALEQYGYFNVDAWLRNEDYFQRFLARFFEGCHEPHSTKEIEDGIGYALQSSPQAIARAHLAWQPERDEDLELCRQVRCPSLVIHGSADTLIPAFEGEALAKELGARFQSVEGSGHFCLGRRPVEVNLGIRGHIDPEFAARPPQRAGRGGPKRALFICSPIGLGHAQRDIAIARELREQVPDLQIDWLAQDPVTRVLAAEGESVHPASAHLANESGHIECESAEHDLHAFQSLRRMDEIMIHNFMIYHEVMQEGGYDLTIGDEAWEVDYYLHENPGEKRSPYVWLTDFVGFLPMQEGGSHEAFLTADYNEEMIGHIARHPEVRDRAIFVGNPDDVVAERFGPELPWIRDWTSTHFDFAGYVSGFDPKKLGPRDELRHEFGYGEDEKVCIVSVGGSGVGEHLLRKVIDAFPEARRQDPALRMVVVAGPRIDPASLGSHPGLEVRPYVHNLYRHLSACDLAVVQGGLTTAMELTAAQRPFLYFPLRHHFEQNFHVRHRLGNYRAGRCMDFDDTSREELAAAIVSEVDREVDYRDVETNGARIAAARIAELL